MSNGSYDVNYRNLKKLKLTGSSGFQCILHNYVRVTFTIYNTFLTETLNVII